MNDRLTTLKTTLWGFVGVLGVVTVVRFSRGLGAVTNLSDATPWGLWIGFDVMAGVALAAGGFVLAAAVYIFGLERYRPFVRPAILTAFLGYIAVAVGLLYDIGLPWNIWHPAVFWQYHSVLFEVAACVMLYLTVLTLEFAPVVLEHPLFDRRLFKGAYRIIRKLTIPLVIAGIILSTLHQSSLGSLFLITPYRLHELWYSPIIYVLFFVSAVGLGLMMVIMESLFADYFFGHRVRIELLSGLAAAAATALFLYLLLRLGDLTIRGVLASSVDRSWPTALFTIELAVSAIIPATLLTQPHVRSSRAGLAVCSAMTMVGMILYRLDVSVTAFARPPAMAYFPSWMEFAVSFGIVSVAGLVFIFFVERLRVYEETPRDLSEVIPLSVVAEADDDLRGMAVVRRYSMAGIVAAAVTVLFLPERAIKGARPVAAPTSAPRTVCGLATERSPDAVRAFAVTSRAEAGEDQPVVPLLFLDGDRDLEGVLFDHEGHAARLSGAESCDGCHHLDMPLDDNSSCVECHRDMYQPTPMFDHTSHVSHMGGNDGCEWCHSDARVVKTFETSARCSECHQGMGDPPARFDHAAHNNRVAANGECATCHRDVESANPFSTAGACIECHDAPGYVDAMHGLCVRCHEEALQAASGYPADLARCSSCHETDRCVDVRRMLPAGGNGNATGTSRGM